ncbi:MaoC family dehydratase [Georgenia yuyongxinii]|uniref:MaoC-like domain-containing protein n=1 Tax=Georgenia yuyongxinii TaxID=2589797 RepID=A0A552WXN4_9MICO|nr:MaoC family dehydratase [Georgenia yuyongxinii]TRW47572.1 hypothetical protein FJ693_00220 [Georgenia yuyongxinii]
MTVATRKPVEYELMEIGEDLGPVEIDIDEHFVKSTAFTVDDYRAWHLGAASPFGGPVAHAGALLCDLLRLLYTRYDPDRDRGLHQREEFWLHSPVFVGERVRLTGRFVDKYVKRGRGYIVTEAEARTVEDDRLIIRHRAIETTEITAARVTEDERVDAVPPRRVRGELPTDRPLGVTVGPEAQVGDPLAGPRKVVHQDQMSIYSGAHTFWRSIHTDHDVAVESGLKGTVAQGLMVATYLSEWATDLFGAAWFTNGWMSLSFLAPLFAEDTISMYGVVSGVTPDGDGTRIEVEAWAENQDGQKAVVGWFAATIGQDKGR